jgi:hypothetical protein
MLQTELMHRQQQHTHHLGTSRVIMGGLIVDSDPSVDSAASAAAAAAAASSSRALAVRHHGRDIVCSGQAFVNFQVLCPETATCNIIVTSSRALSARQCRALQQATLPPICRPPG